MRTLDSPFVVGLLTALVLLGACSSNGPSQAQADIVTDMPGGTPGPTLAPGEAPRPPAADESVSSAETADAVTPVPRQQAAATIEAGVFGDGLFPTVIDATASARGATTWNFAVTLLSEYDSPDRYADAWRVLDADDNELGIRVLGHDHAGEQPFTRSHTVEVPEGIMTVFIEGRDQVNGWSGERFELTLG